MPVLIGLVVSLPLGIVCVRCGWLYPPVLGLTSILYALPALALFVVLIAYTGLTDTTVMIPLAVYSLAVLFPSVVDGLRSVPEPVRQAAVAMGFGTWRRLVTVELPIATPVVIAGPAGRRGVEHQPGQRRRADRHRRPRLPVHRRRAARLHHRDRRGHRR